MNVSRDQVVFLKATLWPDACAAQGWDVKDRDLQMDLLSKIVGREITSSNDLEKIKEFGKVKRELLRLADNLDGPLDSSIEDEARRLRNVIRTELLPCIALYVPDAAAYMGVIIRDGIHRGRKVETRDLDELTAHPRITFRNGARAEAPSELHQLIMTLNARLNSAKPPGLRNRAGHTLHDMRTKAGVGCACATCTAAAMQGYYMNTEGQWVSLQTATAPAAPVVPELVGATEEGDPF